MFPVFVNDGSQEMPDHDIMYIVCKEGIYLKKKLGIMESITPVKEVSILSSVEMTAQMNIKPIPGTLFAQVIHFFNAVYKEHRGEAIVLLFYNEQKRTYKIVPPAQEVSAAGVDYQRAMTMEGYTMIGDIHSHANFSAFHSGIDDDDEKSFDGLHITIGNNGDDEVSLSASIVSNGQRFIIFPEDYINGIELTVDIDEEVEKPYGTVHIWDAKLKKLVPKPGATQRTYKVKRYDKRYKSTVSAKYQTFPAGWMQLVTKKKWATYTSAWAGGNWKNWDKNKFDRNAWSQHHKYNQHNTQGVPPQARPPLVPAKTSPITFPPHSADGAYEEVLDDDFNPCEACPFKEHKIDWVMEQITEAEETDAGEIEWYQCVQCEAVIYCEEGDPICPHCDTDDHLVELDENEVTVMDRNQPDQPDGHDPAYDYRYKCKECATESDVVNHGKCAFCGGNVMDQIDQDAMRAANEADETLESLPIPVPDENRIPLATFKKNKKRNKPGVFASLFNKRNKKK